MKKDIETLYLENEALVHEIIRRHYPQFVNTNNYDDAVQDGSIALLKAIEKFNPSLGFKFSTYAYPVIKGAIYKSMYKKESNLKVSRNCHAVYMKYKCLSKEGYTFDEIVSKLNTTPYTLLNIVNTFNKSSLDCIINIDSEDGNKDTNLLDVIPDNVNIEKELETKFELTTGLILCKSFLEKKDYIIIYNYCNGMNQTEAGKKVGLSQVTVSRRIITIRNKVFPYFKQYIQGDLKYGLLCLKLLDYNECVKLNIISYFNYILELIARGECSNNFLDEMKLILDDIGSKQLKNIANYLYGKCSYTQEIKLGLEAILNKIDEYYSTNKIEVIVYDIISILKKGKCKDYMTDFRHQLKAI